MNCKTGKIEDKELGYDEFFENARNEMKLGDLPVARVTAEYRGAYKVKNTKGEYFAKVTGKHMFDASVREDYPAVGDWVVINELPEWEAVIRAILPRKTVIKRRGVGGGGAQVIAANIDVALIVESADRDFSLNRFERYFTLANAGGIRPVALLNKVDLMTGEELELRSSQLKERFGDIDVLLTSALDEKGADVLRGYIEKGKTYCFLGSSGVGKSSLINRLLGEDTARTEEISARVGRGKHITTGREMYFLGNGGIVIDNPGMREVGMADAGSGLDNIFEEIKVLSEKCRYSDCTHTCEPGCEVLAKVKAGEMDEGKYANYIGLKKESDFYEMSEYERKEKDRKFGKFIKKAKDELKRHEG